MALRAAWRASWAAAAWLLPNLPAEAFSPVGPLALGVLGALAASAFGGALAVFRRRDDSAR